MYEKIWILNIEVAPIHICKLVWYDWVEAAAKGTRRFFPLLTVALQLMTVAVTKYSVAVFRNRQSATSRSLSQCPFKEVQRQKKKTPQLWVNCEWFNSVPCWKMFFANANCIALPASFQCVQHRVCDFVKGERKLLNPFSCSGCDCHDASWRYTESRGTTAVRWSGTGSRKETQHLHGCLW